MKNTMMRIASILMVVALLTACVISGTFAKYVTSKSAEDTARVANFGVAISATGEAFKDKYETTDTTATFEGDYSVEVGGQSTDKLVAPGTNGSVAAVAITGTPEVAVRVAFTATVTLSKWEVEVPAASADAQATKKYYCPLEITVGSETLKGLDYTSAEAFAAAIKAEIEKASAEYAPNTDLSSASAPSISWAWAFEGNDDVKDTALGDAAAAGNAETITIALAVSVTQID